jgi:hypothetical protein
VLLADRGVSGEAIAEAYDAFEKGKITSPMAQAALSSQTIQESMRLILMVRAFQVGAWGAGPSSMQNPRSSQIR